ncbi:MAG: DUF2238 domain-containing protein [Deltaproteobacteria bacterium]|nr:DUF2238 domain-containing protein [Deltaproteobacteria bacterium]
METKRFILFFTVASLLILALSFIAARDRFTWVLEVAPIIIALPLLFFTYGRFQFTGLVYSLLLLHFVILAVGGIYTYAKVPLGFWMQDWFGFSRNHYDRIGHFFQGFVPALVLRELLIRKSPLVSGKWLFTIIVWMCLGFSAFYELIEWWTAAVQGADADAFLGSQGDIWDAQKDMLLAFLGAISALLLFSRFHDKMIEKTKG